MVVGDSGKVGDGEVEDYFVETNPYVLANHSRYSHID